MEELRDVLMDVLTPGVRGTRRDGLAWGENCVMRAATFNSSPGFSLQVQFAFDHFAAGFSARDCLKNAATSLHV